MSCIELEVEKFPVKIQNLISLKNVHKGVLGQKQGRVLHRRHRRQSRRRCGATLNVGVGVGVDVDARPKLSPVNETEPKLGRVTAFASGRAAASTGRLRRRRRL